MKRASAALAAAVLGLGVFVVTISSSSGADMQPASAARMRGVWLNQNISLARVDTYPFDTRPVAGISAYALWYQIEAPHENYDWSYFDSVFAVARARNLPVHLRIVPGRYTPG